MSYDIKSDPEFKAAIEILLREQATYRRQPGELAALCLQQPPLRHHWVVDTELPPKNEHFDPACVHVLHRFDSLQVYAPESYDEEKIVAALKASAAAWAKDVMVVAKLSAAQVQGWKGEL